MEGGPSGFRPGFTCPILLGYSLGRVLSFAYGAITLYGHLSSVVRLDLTFVTAAGFQNSRAQDPQPPAHNASGLACTRFRLCPLRSPLLRTSRFLSLPGVTKMFQFTPFASDDYSFIVGSRGMNRVAFPHSEIPGSKVVCTSPGLIAADHVLHRLSAPRHPPHTLSSLTTEMVGNHVRVATVLGTILRSPFSTRIVYCGVLTEPCSHVKDLRGEGNPPPSAARAVSPGSPAHLCEAAAWAGRVRR